MTQELIANMLGVRRSGVTEAALTHQDAGLIRYNYGHIEVSDRSGLERRVCECYGLVRREFDRLLRDLNAFRSGTDASPASMPSLPYGNVPTSDARTRRLTHDAQTADRPQPSSRWKRRD